MKILFIHPYFHIKTGSGKLMFSEAEILKQKGHEIFFFTTDKKPYYDENYEYIDYFPKHVDYKSLNPVELLKNSLKPLYNNETAVKLDKLLKKIRPDVVHVHGTGIHLSDTVLKTCHDNNVPIVTTIHGAGFFCPAGTYMKSQKAVCDNTDCIRGNYLKCLEYACSKRALHLQIPYLAFYSLNRKLLGYEKYISRFICPSNAIKNIGIQAGIEAEKLTTVYNFVDKELINHKPVFTRGNYFLYVGRLDEDKGVHYLIEAMKTLPEEIQLHIIGKGAEENNLKLMAKGFDNIKFKGFMTGKDLEEEYKNCIATILPSNCFEAFGLMVAESFAYGKPVIASNIGGIPELIEQNINGILVKPGDSQEIAQNIMELNNNPELAINMGKQGKLKVENQFNTEIHYQKLVEVYKSIN